MNDDAIAVTLVSLVLIGTIGPVLLMLLAQG
jgi:hypothetical protein